HPARPGRSTRPRPAPRRFEGPARRSRSRLHLGRRRHRLEGRMSTATETRQAATQTRPTDAVAIVTGAARGISAATAHALADDGWSVALAHRRSDATA